LTFPESISVQLNCTPSHAEYLIKIFPRKPELRRTIWGYKESLFQANPAEASPWCGSVYSGVSAVRKFMTPSIVFDPAQRTCYFETKLKRSEQLDKIPNTLELAKELIRIDSTSRRSNLAIIDYIQTILEKSGFVLERLLYADENGTSKANLVAKKGKGRGGFGIFCHSDTVPPGEEEWKPFDPKVEDGRLIGRGSCDMKGALAAAIVAGANIDPAELSKPYYIVITADEETGMWGAMHVIAESGILKQSWPENGVVAEPTSLIPIRAHKGAVRIFVTAQGKAAHTSTDKGISANFLIAPFLAEMAELADLFRSDKRFMNDKFHPPTNGFNMVIDDGGCNPNVTPAKTVCTMSLRTMPDDSRDMAIDLILKAAEKYGLEGRHLAVEPFSVSAESEILQAALDITGCNAGATAHYGTEALFYQDYVNLIIFGPGDINQAHTVGEWIDIEQIRAAESYYTQLIKRCCRFQRYADCKSHKDIEQD